MNDNAILIGLSRQTALRRQMDIIANNLANLGTAGFRSESIIFAEHLMPGAAASTAGGVVRHFSYAVDKASMHDFRPGALESTGNPLDVGLEGDGWLVVETPEGERYTRNGALKLDGDGALVTSAGHRVLGEGGPVVFEDDETDVTFAADGTISTSFGEKDRLRIVAFEDNAVLQAEGASLFATENAPAAAEGVRLVQGMVEGSNVQPIVEMARMIEVTRSYTALSRMLERSDELRRDAIGTLGRVE